MGYVDKLDLERPDFHEIAGPDGLERDAGDLVFLKPAFDQGESERGSVNRDVKLVQEKTHRADVVFVAVREQEGADAGAVFLEEGQVRRDDVDAQELAFREHHPGVDYDDIVAVA